MMGYKVFIQKNYRFLLFGFALAFMGNTGQTFYIAVFGAQWRAAFDLSHTQYSAYYSLATLLSGFLLMWAGARLDKSDLKKFTLSVMIGTAIACLCLALTFHAWMLLIGFFMIRFMGQGLSCHIAFTSMAKCFDKNRGKAISIAAMSMPAGEVILPLMAVALMNLIGWRWTWGVTALGIIFVFIPFVLWALNDSRAEHSYESNVQTNLKKRQWQRKEVVRESSFWLAVIAVMSPAFIITSLFFHQTYWAELHQWRLESIALSMTLYGVIHAFSSIASGYLVDRLGAKRMIKWYLLPLCLSLGSLIAFDGFISWLFFMGLAGLSIGASGPVVGSMWPEIYGTQYLGSIRALVSSLMVLSTAIAPLFLGILIDLNVAYSVLIGILLGYACLSLLICQRVYQKQWVSDH